MSNQRLVHDTAWAAAAGIMDRIGCVFLDGERRDAFALIYEHVRAALETFLIMEAREERRLCRPSKN
jgi:hypothetical protein